MKFTHLGRSGLRVSRLGLGLFPGYRPAPEHYAW
jgi:aryl-alcohol dehydrogenase-like predicted oxidoreductase